MSYNNIDISIKIRGDFYDMQDLLNVARDKGKSALKVKKVRVYPYIERHGHDFIVIVEPWNGVQNSRKPFTVEGKSKEIKSEN